MTPFILFLASKKFDVGDFQNVLIWIKLIATLEISGMDTFCRYVTGSILILQIITESVRL